MTNTHSHLTDFIRALPKAELHVHLEGSMTPEFVHTLARRHGHPLGEMELEELLQFYRHRDFLHFLENFKTLISVLQTPTALYDLVLNYLQIAKENNIVYAEVHFTPLALATASMPYPTLMEAIQKGVYEAAARGLELQVIIDTVRQWGPQHVEETLRLHQQHPVPCVVALGMGGNETAYPPAAFESAFAWARQSGLRTVVHSGESGNAASIRQTLDRLKPDRIMHGVRAMDDPRLVEQLAAWRTPLDVCPTSNVCTGVVAHLKEHPVHRLYEAGVSISINTDDPAMFNTTLNQEYELLLTELGFTPEELYEVARNAFKNSFLPASRKAGYLQAQEMIWRAFRQGQL